MIRANTDLLWRVSVRSTVSGEDAGLSAFGLARQRGVGLPPGGYGCFVKPPLAVLVMVAALAGSGCSSKTRSSLSSDARNVGTEVANAAASAKNNAAETLARNVATQQGEQQFKSAGQELAGPLTCEAKIQDGISKVVINCTGKTKAGGAAVLSGTTSEIPGASVVALNGEFIGSVDGAQVFTTQRLGN